MIPHEELIKYSQQRRLETHVIGWPCFTNEIEKIKVELIAAR